VHSYCVSVVQCELHGVQKALLLSKDSCNALQHATLHCLRRYCKHIMARTIVHLHRSIRIYPSVKCLIRVYACMHTIIYASITSTICRQQSYTLKTVPGSSAEQSSLIPCTAWQMCCRKRTVPGTFKESSAGPVPVGSKKFLSQSETFLICIQM
jgi:hypothetical protein